MMHTHPYWLNREEYPFDTQYMHLPAGKIHYVDEGTGEVLVMVHGNPEWSFSYRKIIKALSNQFRCVAPDHIGFGLSDKPSNWSYLPQDHAQNFELFIITLGFKDITLIVNDWGGPIGLSYAIKYPDNVKRLVIMNTWMWSVKNDLYYQAFSGFMGSSLGKWLIKRYNFFLNVIVRLVLGKKQKFPREIFEHYHKPIEKPKDRKGSWTLPGQMVGSSSWLQNLWEKRGLIKDKPSLIFWGMKDLGFREKELKVWEHLLTHKLVIRLDDAGHFPHEEEAERLIKALKKWISPT